MVTGGFAEGVMEIALKGRIDSTSAPETEKEIMSLLDGRGSVPVVLDAGDLEYISSAGLRVLLHLKKNNPDLKIINVDSEIYEILDMTGFTQMMEVKRAIREISVEGCDMIGKGSNGTLYRIDQDTVVKVYNHADAQADIQHEREMARIAQSWVFRQRFLMMSSGSERHTVLYLNC